MHWPAGAGIALDAIALELTTSVARQEQRHTPVVVSLRVTHGAAIQNQGMIQEKRHHRCSSVFPGSTAWLT